MINEETRATLIATHYRDSCKSLSRQLATRNKELIWLFAIFTLTMLNAYYPDLFSEIVPRWLKLEGTAKVPLPVGFAGFILLFAVVLLVGDIYNLSIAIEQTVTYLGSLEQTLAVALGTEAITRYHNTRRSRPTLLTRTALAFGASFSAISSALTLAILWGDSHTINSSTGLWFFILDLLLGIGILYMSVLFVRAFTKVGRTTIAVDPEPRSGTSTGKIN